MSNVAKADTMGLIFPQHKGRGYCTELKGEVMTQFII